VKPDVERFLEVAAMHLLVRTAPELSSGYSQASVAVIAALLGAVREEFERAAARRVEENQALRALFTRAVPVVREAGLRGRLEEAAAPRDLRLGISALEAENAGLRALLIDLHAHVEEMPGTEARGIEEAIWRELAASTERRRLAIGSF
jgi:hypothetical protein